MEKCPPEKSNSFSRNENDDSYEKHGNSSPRGLQPGPQADADVKRDSPKPVEFGQDQQVVEEPPPDPELSLAQVLEDVDRYLQALSTASDESEKPSEPPEVPSSVESLFTMAEEIMAKYGSIGKFGQNQEEDSSVLESLNRITKLINLLRKSPSAASCLNRASGILHQALTFLDGEFCSILESCNHKSGDPDLKSPKASKQSSAGSHHQQSDQCVPEPDSKGEDEFPGYSPEEVNNMNRIATAMITSGYDRECCMRYNMMRRGAFLLVLDKQGFGNLSVEDVHRMQWESLEGEIATWIKVMKHCSNSLFASERKLCCSVFPEHPSISQILFGDIAVSVTIRFLNFAEAITLIKRSAEKLFKFLDMYETVRDLVPSIDDTYSGNYAEELKFETWAAKTRLGEAAVCMFCDLENSIRRENGKIPVPSGEVHPLTRYTMNYLKYTCEYKDTLEEVFKHHQKMEESSDSQGQDTESSEGDSRTPEASRFGVQLNKIMDMLEENLDTKSKLYKDHSLRFIFLMNNGRYILQKIKGSNEMYGMMGVTWCRKLSSNLRMYHKSYTRETWSRLLQCLTPEGLQVNGKVAKPVLKERFKMFNAMFDEIHRTQSSWVVRDEQLQSELRVSVSAVVIPAYRSFLGRFQQYLTSGRQSEKYIKFQPEDIENSIDELFGGNPASMAKRKM